MNRKTFSLRGPFALPTDGVRTSLAVFAVATASAAWAAGVIAPAFAAAALLLGLAVLAVAMRSQAAAERLAATLCDGAEARGAPLSQTLPRISERLEATAHRTANVNATTGLPTREHLYSAIAADIAEGCGPRLMGAIRFTDFDRQAAFDSAAANAALKQFSQRLVSGTRTSQVVAQVDRDCFAVWFRDGDDVERSDAEFRAIVYVCGQEFAVGAIAVIPTIEASAVRFPQDGSDAAQLLLRAMAALARPQTSAGGEISLVHPPSVDAARAQFSLEQDLAQAISEEQLTMFFQPIVDLSLGRMIGAEALLRWNHPILGPVSPARFIPIVETIGLSEQYGLWVLNAACREARRLQDEGLHGLKIAVNLSARQLLDPTLKSKIERTLKRHDLGPGALELELTETATMADAVRTKHLFAELRAMGVSLAIDDFGSGYSSLSYLKNLPFDKLKIDREFVTGIQHHADSRAICTALIGLGQGLGLAVLAEGVEDAAEVETLRALGCRVFQGYYFSKPLSGDDFRRLAKDPAWCASLRAPSRHRQPKPVGRLSA